MINPDIENIILISDSDFKQLEIENVTKLKMQNNQLKTLTILIIAFTFFIVISNIKNENKKKGLTDKN